jgi:hypothetical protein
MSQLTLPVTTTTQAPSSRIWRIAGGLALAHLVIIFAAITQEVIVEHGTPLSTIQSKFAGANLTHVLGAGYVESLAFLVLVPALVSIAHVFGSRTETGRLAAQTFLALGVAYAAATLAVGFAPGGAALYGAQHGADIHSVAMVNDIRNYSYMLQVALQGAMALALAVAALAEGVGRRCVGYGGLAVGTLVILGVPFAHNVVGMAWMIWWVVLAVILLRGPQEAASIRPAS